MHIKHILIAASFLFISLNASAACDASYEMDIDAVGDTVCVGVAVNFHNSSNLNGETIATSQWLFGDGSPPEGGIDISHAYTNPGTYTIRLNTGSNSCPGEQVSRDITVIAAPTLQGGAVNQSCYGICDGAASVFVTGAASNYNILWSDNQFTEIAVGLCEGVYSVTVSDNYGCESSLGGYSVAEPDSFIVNAGVDISLCIGDPVYQMQVSASGGTGPFVYEWTPGISAGLDDPNVPHPFLTPNPNSFTTFTFKGTDANGCFAADQMVVRQRPAKISGTVYKGTGTSAPLQSGVVYLIAVHTNPDVAWRYIDTVQIQSNGTYLFDSVYVQSAPAQSYILLAKDTAAPFTIMPTYYGNQAYWEDATQISPVCNAVLTGKNINCMVAEDQNQSCMLKGTVYLVTIGKTQSEDPIPLIDVVVKKTPPGNGIAYTQTGDGTDPEVPVGEFQFHSMMTTSGDTAYSFVINVPGLGMQGNYDVEIALDDSLHDNLNFYVDTTPGTGGVWITNPLGVEVVKFKQTDLQAYPNPFTDQCVLLFSNATNELFNFNLYDVTGKLISHAEQLRGTTYPLKTSALEQGMYIAEITTVEKTLRARIIKN